MNRGIVLAGLLACACTAAPPQPELSTKVDEPRRVEVVPEPSAAATSPAVVVSARELELAAGRPGFVAFDPGLLGRRVAAGDQLFELRRADDRARLELAAADVEVHAKERRRGEALLERRREEHSQVRTLEGFVAADAIGEADSAERLAAVEVDILGARGLASRRELELVEHELAAGDGRAPFAGLVSAALCEPGSWIELGAPILRLEDPDDLRLRFAVEPERARTLELGASLRWRRGTDEGTAKVVEREPRVRPISGLVYLEARVDADAGLVLGEVVELVWDESVRTGSAGGRR